MVWRTSMWLGLGLLVSGAASLGLGDGATSRLNHHEFWAAKSFPGRLFEGVLIGDSRVYRGLSPAVMDDRLGVGTVHNFGYSSARFARPYLNAAAALLKTMAAGAPDQVLSTTSLAPPA